MRSVLNQRADIVREIEDVFSLTLHYKVANFKKNGRIFKRTDSRRRCDSAGNTVVVFEVRRGDLFHLSLHNVVVHVDKNEVMVGEWGIFDSRRQFFPTLREALIYLRLRSSANGE